jgi:hypothetical protein
MHGKTFASMQIRRPKTEAGKPMPRYVEFELRSTPITEEARK